MKVLAKLIYGLGVAVFAVGIVPLLILFLFVAFMARKIFEHGNCGVTCCPYCKHEDL